MTTSPPSPTILVPLDGSPTAEAVLPVAITLARALPAAISLLHVIERDAPRRVHGEQHLTDKTEAETYLAGVARRLETEGVNVTWHVHVVPVGNVPLSIAAHAAEEGSSLILLSTHPPRDPRSWLTGAVAQGVIRHAAPPVLLLRADPRQGIQFAPQEVRVTLDTGRQGEVALPPALRLARALGIPVRLLMVVPTVETIPGDQAAAARLIPSGAAAALDLEEAAARDYLGGLASRIAAAGVPVELEVARGDPAQAVAAIARARPGITALATHGRAGLNALWTGSVGSRVIARAEGPFLLVHPEPAGDASLG